MTKEYLYMGKVRVAMVDVAGGGTVYAYHNDRLGTPELLTTVVNQQETVAWEAWYEPFGEAHIHPSSNVVNNITSARPVLRRRDAGYPLQPASLPGSQDGEIRHT